MDFDWSDYFNEYYFWYEENAAAAGLIKDLDLDIHRADDVYRAIWKNAFDGTSGKSGEHGAVEIVEVEDDDPSSIVTLPTYIREPDEPDEAEEHMREYMEFIKEIRGLEANRGFASNEGAECARTRQVDVDKKKEQTLQEREEYKKKYGCVPKIKPAEAEEHMREYMEFLKEIREQEANCGFDLNEGAECARTIQVEVDKKYEQTQQEREEYKKKYGCVPKLKKIPDCKFGNINPSNPANYSPRAGTSSMAADFPPMEFPEGFGENDVVPSVFDTNFLDFEPDPVEVISFKLKDTKISSPYPRLP